MHPKALLDNCSELLKQVLKFDYPADMVVSRYFRELRLGPRERATLAETVYGVLRGKTVFRGRGTQGCLRQRRFLNWRFDWQRWHFRQRRFLRDWGLFWFRRQCAYSAGDLHQLDVGRPDCSRQESPVADRLV